MTVHIRTATLADVPALLDLVHSAYRGESQLVDGYGNNFISFHYDVNSIGRSARNAVAEHLQGAYVINSSGGQQSYAPLP